MKNNRIMIFFGLALSLTLSAQTQMNAQCANTNPTTTTTEVTTPAPTANAAQIETAIAATSTAPMSNYCVHLFTASNFGGQELKVTQSTNTLNLTETQGGANFTQAVSSVKIPKGWAAVLFDQPNFQGESVVLTASNNDLTGQNFSNRAASIKVYNKAQVEAIANQQLKNKIQTQATNATPVSLEEGN